MVQSTGISDNNFLQYTGHGTNGCHNANTDHHIFFRYCRHPLEVQNEEDADNSVDGQHDKKRSSCCPNTIMVNDNTINRKRTQNYSDNDNQKQDNVAYCGYLACR